MDRVGKKTDRGYPVVLDPGFPHAVLSSPDPLTRVENCHCTSHSGSPRGPIQGSGTTGTVGKDRDVDGTSSLLRGNDRPVKGQYRYKTSRVGHPSSQVLSDLSTKLVGCSVSDETSRRR